MEPLHHLAITAVDVAFVSRGMNTSDHENLRVADELDMLQFLGLEFVKENLTGRN